MANVTVRERELKQLIIPKQKMIATFMGDSARAKRFMATLLAVGSDPNLSSCTPDSIVEAGIAAAMLRLLPDKNMGQAYLVPYRTKGGHTVCQLQVGYRGFITMLERIGWHLKAHAVYSVDEFSFEVDGWEERMVFKPDFDARQNDPAWVYENLEKIVTVVRSKSGELFYNVMGRQEIEKIRMKSQNQKDPRKPSGVWWEWYEQMAIKSAIKRHIKRLPIGEQDVTVALGIDDIAERGSLPDYKKFQKEQVVIEADIDQVDTPAGENVGSDVDAMLIQAAAPAEEKGGAKRSAPDPLAAALIQRGVARSKALRYAKENADKADVLLSDPGALDAMAEELTE